MNTYLLAVAAALFTAGAGGLAVWIWRRERRLPRGKGAFVRGLTAEGTAAQLVVKARELGLTWLALAGESWSGQVATHYPQLLPMYVDALEKAGIAVYLWGWPLSADTAAQLGAEARRVRARGVIFNLEKQVYPGQSADVLRHLQSSALRSAEVKRWVGAAAKASGGPVGVISYPDPTIHPAFPWEGVRGAAFGMPEVYGDNLSTELIVRGVRRWNELTGYVVPIWGGSSEHTPDEMRAIVARTPRPEKAGGWWTLDYVLASAGRSAAVRDMNLGAAVA